MGQEVAQDSVGEEEAALFSARLRDETRLLKSWFDARRFVYSDGFTCGMELEAWLVDENWLPAPENEAFLEALDDPLVVHELSQFNFELNCEPASLTGAAFGTLREELARTWASCRQTAAAKGLTPLMIGILPTVRDEMLQLDWMSASNRYRLLNERLFALRQERPLNIDITGEDRLQLSCETLMIEAASTSVQAHLQVNQEDAKRFYNASLIVSAATVACAANAPFLYGKSLWAESRVPTFEQALAHSSHRDREGRNVQRVTFGSGYLRRSLLEPFLENLNGYPPLLPALSDDPAERLKHLRLQNGTVWRWNRPIIGFDGHGEPHLRIEHRVMSAGPTLDDVMANIALYLGLTLAYGRRATPPEEEIPFEAARDNFYAAARHGLGARVRWTGNDEGDLQPLLLQRLLPEAKAALAECGVDDAELDFYFDDILKRRVLTGRTGTDWQRSFIDLHGPNFQALTEAYAERQESGQPVHRWRV